MAIYTEEIYSEAKKFGGESETLKVLCAVAEDSLRRNLKDDAKEEEFKDTLIQAAAMLAESMLAVAETGGGIEYSVGNVSVKTGGAVSAANVLREQAEIMMAPFMKDSGFAFLEVRG